MGREQCCKSSSSWSSSSTRRLLRRSALALPRCCRSTALHIYAAAITACSCCRTAFERLGRTACSCSARAGLGPRLAVGLGRRPSRPVEGRHRSPGADGAGAGFVSLGCAELPAEVDYLLWAEARGKGVRDQLRSRMHNWHGRRRALAGKSLGTVCCPALPPMRHPQHPLCRSWRACRCSGFQSSAGNTAFRSASVCSTLLVAGVRPHR